jgi:hypothetical protein
MFLNKESCLDDVEVAAQSALIAVAVAMAVIVEQAKSAGRYITVASEAAGAVYAVLTTRKCQAVSILSNVHSGIFQDHCNDFFKIESRSTLMKTI